MKHGPLQREWDKGEIKDRPWENGYGEIKWEFQYGVAQSVTITKYLVEFN